MSNQLQVSGEAKIRTIQGPVVANSGVITALNGDATEYVRGDGTLADFPTSTGGGSSVSYYLNTSVSQGTIGGVAYKQLSKVPISGAGTDVSTSVDGYIASYITDANDPALLEVPAGNFNCEFYFSVNSNAHNSYVYAEVYKYDGTTFTLLGSNVSIPQYLSNGTTLSPYYFAIAVSTAVLTVTDRIAIRIYVNVDTRTVTLHTENNHLCQVVTTFSKGLISLNNLTRQNQFFATGTSGTDFAISSATATHTFNLPVASAANTGKLSSTDWSTFNGKVPYTGATANVDLGIYSITGGIGTFTNGVLNGNGTNPANLYLKKGSAPFFTNAANYGLIAAVSSSFILISDVDGTNYKYASFNLASLTNNTNRAYTLPDASGTLALLSADQTFTGINSFDYGINYKTGASLANVSGYISQAYATSGTGAGSTLSLKISDGNSVKAINLDFVGSPATYTYTFPAATGTLPLGTGTTNYHAKWTGTNTIGNSLIWDNGTNVGIGTTSPNAPLNVVKDDGVSAGLHILADFNRNTSSAELIFGYNADGTNVTTNTIYSANSLPLAFHTTAIERMRITATGAVAIGTTNSFYANSTRGALAIAGSLDSIISFQNPSNTASYTYLYSDDTANHNFYIQNTTANGNLYLATNSTVRATITSAGNVGIGTSSPSRNFVVQNSSSVVLASLVSNPANIAYLLFGDTDADAQGRVQYDNASDSLQLYSNGSERMRITSGGNVGVGISGVYSDVRLMSRGASATASDYSFRAENSTGGNLFFARNDGLLNTGLAAQSPYNLTIAASANCHIFSDGALFRATSSKRYKTDIEDLSVNTFELINKIRPVWYRSLCERDKKDWSWYGFIAEELAEIDPRFVQFGYASEDYIKDEITNETKLKENAELRADGVMYDRLTVLLIKGMQEQQIQIQNLQEQINILQNK